MQLRQRFKQGHVDSSKLPKELKARAQAALEETLNENRADFTELWKTRSQRRGRFDVSLEVNGDAV